MVDFMLKAPRGANKKKKIVGRGQGSGHGSTSCRGDKGQQSRSGGGPYVGFEGGQMPLYRRIARRGFSNYLFSKQYECFNLEILDKKFNDGEVVDNSSLTGKGLLKKSNSLVKVLGNGNITKKLTFNVDKVSASAKEKIEKLGGTVNIKDSKNGQNNGK